MGRPIATTKPGGICFAFPDVCLTPPGPAPVPYPNVAQMSDAEQVTSTVEAGGYAVIVEDSTISKATGNEAGTAGGVAHGTAPINCHTDFRTFSGSVKAEGKRVVRMLDTTGQNVSGTIANATGQVLGGEPLVLVGD